MLPYERLQACVAAIRQKTDFVPRTALVLGSGLGGFGERLALEAAVDYKDIPGFPVSTCPATRAGSSLALWGRSLWWPCRAASTITRATPWRTWCCPSG